jgi:hypothetical protein
LQQLAKRDHHADFDSWHKILEVDSDVLESLCDILIEQVLEFLLSFSIVLHVLDPRFDI